MAFSPDSRRLLTVSEDGIVRVWDAATGTPLHDLVGHANRVLCAAYSPDSQQLLSSSGDHTIRIWDTQPLKDRVQARRERQSILLEVEPMVQRLFAQLGDASKVVERVKANALLTARARQIALQVAFRISLDRINAAAGLLRP